MRDTQILSVFHETQPAQQDLADGLLVFDACQVGVVLRSVLFVETVTGVAAMFGTSNPEQWLLLVSLMTGGVLPACLLWLLAACTAKRLLARIGFVQQYLCGVLLGALAGLFGCATLSLSGFLEPAPWLSSACSGALLSAVLVGGLVLRAKGRMPADTAARLTELQSRIRPHFLFNTLNTAIALVRAEPAKAETLLEDLSDLFRHALVDQGASVTLSEEIALAKRYLAIEQLRFGDRLQVEWDVEDEATTALVPPLLLQPLVENAVRHGVEPSASGAEIRISVEKRGSAVVIKVSNTVPAGPGPAGAGVALRNVRDRLDLLHDVRGQFRSGLKNGVFQVRMEIPA